LSDYGINFHCTPCLFKASLRDIDLNNFFSSSAADWYVEALSEIMIEGNDLRLTNLLNAWRKVASVKSVTISKYTALVAAQVKRQTYTLFSLPLLFTYRAPVKSTPVVVKGGESFTLDSGNGGGSGAL